MQIDQPIRIPRTHRQTKIPQNVISRREIDNSFDPQHRDRWNRNFMTSLNNHKVHYCERMLNPIVAQKYSNKRGS